MIFKKISKIPLHDIKLYIILHGVLLFILRPYLTFNKGENVITGRIIDNYYNIAFFLGLVAFLTMLLMVLKIKTIGQRLLFTSIVSSITLNRFLLVFSLWFFIYLLLNMNRFNNGFIELLLRSQSDFIHSNNNFISNSITGIYPIFILASFSINVSKYKKVLILLILILFAIPIGMMSGSKTLVVNPLFLLMLRFSAIKNGVSLFFILGLTLIGLPLFASLELLRHEGLIGVLSHFSDSDFFEIENILTFSTNRFYGTDVIYSIVNHHEYLNHPYLFGASLMGIVYFIIPRFLWSEKPIISFGKVVSENYLGPEFWSSGISAAPTWIGELFANFSYFSFPIYVLSLYLILRHIKNCCSINSSAWKKVYYFPIAFTTLSFFQEASIVGWFLQLFVFAILTYFFSILFHGISNTKKHGI